MTVPLFDPPTPAAGPLRRSVDTYLATVDGVPGPMGEHLRLLADALDQQTAARGLASRYGQGPSSGDLMALTQLAREFRETFAAVRADGDGGDPGDSAARALLAELGAPLVQHTA